MTQDLAELQWLKLRENPLDVKLAPMEKTGVAQTDLNTYVGGASGGSFYQSLVQKLLSNSLLRKLFGNLFVFYALY